MVDFSSIVILFAGLFFALLLAQVWVSRRFVQLLQRQVAALRHRGGATPVPKLPVPKLPVLVREFGLRSHPPSSPRACTIRIHQTGAMRLSEQGQWRPFRATQDFAIQQPGFVWRAHFPIAPLVSITVLDSYVEGQGHLEARLWGSIPVVQASGPSADQGELMRYLAEIAFCPDAIFENPDLAWQPLEPQTVALHCGTGLERVTVQLQFNAQGDLSAVFAPDRPRQVGNQVIETPWLGTFSDYAVVGGYRIPTRSEVSWLLESGPFPYWRGQITGLEQNKA